MAGRGRRRVTEENRAMTGRPLGGDARPGGRATGSAMTLRLSLCATEIFISPPPHPVRVIFGYYFFFFRYSSLFHSYNCLLLREIVSPLYRHTYIYKVQNVQYSRAHIVRCEACRPYRFFFFRTHTKRKPRATITNS